MKPSCTKLQNKDMNRVYELAGGNKHEGSMTEENGNSKNKRHN